MPRPDPADTQYIDRAIAAWEEFKPNHFRTFVTSSSDVRRLWAVVLSSDWSGTGAEKMERLLTLLPKAIEQAARLPSFGARTTLWTICRDTKIVEGLAGGLVPTELDEAKLYDQQVLRLKLPETALILVRGEAARRGISASQLVAEIIEDWAAGGI